MCLFITKDCVLKKATKNISFYKWTGWCERKDKTLFVSPTQSYKYYTGIIQSVIDLSPAPSIEEDCPATYFDQQYLSEVIPDYIKKGEEYPCVRKGYHGCFKSFVKNHRDKGEEIYKFIIPKGTEYWHNKKQDSL
jgi:hypothetical protein